MASAAISSDCVIRPVDLGPDLLFIGAGISMRSPVHGLIKPFKVESWMRERGAARQGCCGCCLEGGRSPGPQQLKPADTIPLVGQLQVGQAPSAWGRRVASCTASPSLPAHPQGPSPP